MKSPKSQAGFTLVEIAIVLVIIGLLLTAILKGQELIENSRAKAASQEVQGIKAAYFSYLDRYKRVAGDDGPTNILTARGANWTGQVQGNSNGQLDAPAAAVFTGAGENGGAFRMMRAAGFVTGDPAQVGINALPNNAFGGKTGFVNAVVLGYAQAKLQVCQGNVPGKAASAIDSQSDDGKPNTGTIRATQGANNAIPAAVAAAFNEDQTYTVCSAL